MYALGALPGDAQMATLRAALKDDNARRALERRRRARRHGNNEGVPVLRQMLDRTYVEQAVKREVRQDDDQDPIADVMISGHSRGGGAQG